MQKYRALLAALAALALLPVMAVSAYAAPPTNDTPAGATVITTLPTTISQDTSEATTDALDAELNSACGAPFTNASVWFTYTADGATPGFIVSIDGSDYSGGFLVFEEALTPESLVTCGPGAVPVSTQPGLTYYVMAISDTPVNGGSLVVTFVPAPPSPEVSIQVDPNGRALRDGSVVLTGTYSCSNAPELFVGGSLTQRVGRFKITGSFDFSASECDGTTRPWEATVTSDNGTFAGGKSASVAFAFACGEFQCSEGFAEQSVKLNRGRGR